MLTRNLTVCLKFNTAQKPNKPSRENTVNVSRNYKKVKLANNTGK
jgi:hypothetical protein